MWYSHNMQWMVVNQTCALNMHIHNTYGYICYVYKNGGVNNKLPWGYDRLKTTLNDASAVSSHKNCPSILISTEPYQSGIADRMGWRQQSASDSHSHRGAVVDKRVWAGPKTVRGFRWYNSTPNSTSNSILSLTPSSRYLRPCFGLGGIGGVCVSVCAKWRIKQKAKQENTARYESYTSLFACELASPVCLETKIVLCIPISACDGGPETDHPAPQSCTYQM